MATWFATANGNINSAGRWNSLPNGAGTALTWPPAVDDILVANGRTITVNVSFSVGELLNDTTGGATMGGTFTASAAGISVSANVTATNSNQAVLHFYHISGINYYVGNVLGGTSSLNHGVFLAQAGTLNMTGNVTTRVAGYAVRNGSTGTINLTGTVYGGSSATYAMQNIVAGTIALTGTAIAGDAGPAIINLAGGTVTVSGYAEASTASAAINNVAQGVVSVGETRSASNGRGAVTGAFRYASATALIHKPIADDGSVLTMRPVAAFTLPDEATARNGVAFGADKVGTLAGCNRHHRMSI